MTLNDWRGVPISVGDTVVYGAGVGSSVACVEAKVLRVDESKGRVQVEIIRRASGWGEKPVVFVGAFKVTVVSVLPDSPKLTQTDERIRTLKADIIRYTEWMTGPPENIKNSTINQATLEEWITERRRELDRLVEYVATNAHE